MNTSTGPVEPTTPTPTADNSKVEWFHLALVVSMFVGSALCWSSAPDRVPMHWNASGEIDRWGGKLEGLFLLPAITLGLYFLLRLIPRLDPGQANYAQFKKSYSIIRFATTGVMVVVHAAVLSYVVGYRLDMGLVVGVAVGLMMVVIGNVMGKVRPNWFVGIRTPWTLSSKLAWSKTHRVGGWMFMAVGVLIMIAAVFKSSWAIPVAVGTAIVASLALVVYSWHVWRNDPDRVPPAGTSPASGDS